VLLSQQTGERWLRAEIVVTRWIAGGLLLSARDIFKEYKNTSTHLLGAQSQELSSVVHPAWTETPSPCS
jgi:hypothetical protein